MPHMPNEPSVPAPRTRSSPRARKPVRPRVLILGGGFAGLSAAQSLDAAHYDVKLVDREPDFEFLPNVHELISRVKTPELLRVPLAVAVQRAGHSFVHDTVSAIDPVARAVSLQRRRRALGYDVLIVALGASDATHDIKGVHAHAMVFKSVADCERIGRRLDELAARRKPSVLSVIGGGFRGVEALGEVLRRHRSNECLRVRLVEAQDRLLADAPAVIDAHLRGLCAPYRVAFEMGTPVRRILAKSLELADGRRLASDLTIWTGAPAAPALLARSGLAMPGAWAPVHDSLQSTLYEQVFVAGDAAGLPMPLAKQAYHALDMGAHAAQGVADHLAGRKLRPFRASAKAQLIAFGDLGCYLRAGPRVLAGVALAAGKEAVFELVMAQLDAQPLWRRLPRMAARSQRAAHALLWPSLSSPQALLRQAQVSVLSLG